MEFYILDLSVYEQDGGGSFQSYTGLQWIYSS